jgi:transposase InsO family protein
MKTMPNSTQEEKLRWLTPILEKRMKIKDMASVSPFSERAIKYWLKQYRENGLSGLENRSTRPRSQPNETPIRIKERVLELRHEMNDECALKIMWDLVEEGVSIHERTVGKILKVEGLTRRYRTRKQYPQKPKIKLKPGGLIEIDVKYVPDKINGRRYYQFTAIDCASRWRFLKIYDQQTNVDALDFLREVFKRFPYQIKAIKTDNGSIFTNRYTGYLKSADPINPKLHPFDLECIKLGMTHYLIDPGKPAQNGHVERSHRSDQESFYEKTSCRTVDELRYQAKLWNMYYNDLKHCGLNGLTPNQALRPKVQYVRT